MHSANESKPNASHTSSGGSGEQDSTASVTTARVPSEPIRRRRRSGPAAERGTARRRTTRPPASTAVTPSRRSSIVPYRTEAWPAEATAIHPPTVDSAIDCG